MIDDAVTDEVGHLLSTGIDAGKPLRTLPDLELVFAARFGRIDLRIPITVALLLQWMPGGGGVHAGVEWQSSGREASSEWFRIGPYRRIFQRSGRRTPGRPLGRLFLMADVLGFFFEILRRLLARFAHVLGGLLGLFLLRFGTRLGCVPGGLRV